MREHKYRAWDGKKFITDFSIMNGRVYVLTNPKTDNIVTVAIDGVKHDFYDGWAMYKKVDAELIQYTGLKDKSGKEIYEGDILAVGKLLILGQVMFRPTDGFWATKDNHNFYRIDGDNVYIIGTIHKNPELLEPANVS